jgi:hypothetical protein
LKTYILIKRKTKRKKRKKKIFNIKDIITIDQNEEKYLSFPDIIQSIKNPNRLFIIYREGQAHHPTESKLILKKSEDCGKTWEKIKEFPLDLENNGFVWNCPRFSYLGKTLYIICDAKSSTTERTCNFIIVFFKSKDEGENFICKITPMPGMVPDKIILFKNKYYCANHKIKSEKNDLIQLVSWSKNKELWYNTNIVANHEKRQYCEASTVNVNSDYLITYLRDNSSHRRNIYTTTSEDGINWSEPRKLSIFGQRVTAILDEKDITVGTYRNTDTCTVSIFNHNLKRNRIKTFDIDREYRKNQYHFGYTGLIKIKNTYLVAYYIKQDEKNPYIKLAFLEKK